MFGNTFLTPAAIATAAAAKAATEAKAKAEAAAKATAEAAQKTKEEAEAKAKAEAERLKKTGKTKAQEDAEIAQKAAEDQLKRQKELFELEKTRFKEAQELALKKAQELEKQREALEDDLEEAAEKIHELENIPWHRVKAQQKKAAKERAQALKEAKAAKERQNRIDRGLPVPPLPTKEEIAAQKAAKKALSEKLKGRTKRTAVEQLLGSGGLQSYNEETITNQAAQPMPSDYDWSWRQKRFRDEERVTDRVDRMVSRMVNDDDEKLQEQLRLDRKKYAAEKKKTLLRTGGKGSPSSKSAFAKSTHAVGSGKPGSSGKRTRFANKVAVQEFSDSDYVQALRTSTRRQRTADNQTLASDIALFLDNDDDPAGLFRGLSGYFDDEVIDADEIIELVVDQIPEEEDESEDSSDTSDEITVIRPADFLNEQESDDYSSDSEYEEDYEEDYDVTEALHPEDAAVLDDYYAIEWLNNLLEDAVDEIFLKASDRIDPSGTADGIEFDLLRKQVIYEIQQEFATRLWLVDDESSTKPQSIDLAPFEEEFGPSFGKVLESATRKPVVFAKMAAARRKRRKTRTKLDKTGSRPGVDVSGALDFFNDNDAAVSSGSDTEPETESPAPSSSSASSGSDSESEEDKPDPKNQKDLLEATLKAIQNALNNGREDEDEPFDEEALRKAYGSDWRRRFTDTFRASIGQKGGKGTKGSKGAKGSKGGKKTKGPKGTKGGKGIKKESDEEESEEEESSEEEEKKLKKEKSDSGEDNEESEENDSSGESSEEESDEESSEEEATEEESIEDEEEEEEEEEKVDAGFRNIQLDHTGTLKPANLVRTDPPEFPRVRYPRDDSAVATVQKEMDGDSSGVHEKAAKRERDWATDYSKALKNAKGHHSVADSLIQGDRNFDYDKRTHDAPRIYNEDPVPFGPLSVSAQDTYTIGHIGPLDGEDYEDELDEDEDERGDDIYNGTEVPDPEEPESDGAEEDEEGEETAPAVSHRVTAKRARPMEPPGHYTLVKKRRVSASDLIDNAARLSAEVAALEASIWDPTILPRYRPSSISLPELAHWHARVSDAFRKLSFGVADDHRPGSFWNRERKKILDIGAALKYREALEGGEDFSQGDAEEATDMESDLESAVAAQLEGQHEYRLGTEVQGLGVPKPVMTRAQRALESVRPSRDTRMRDVARRFSTGRW